MTGASGIPALPLRQVRDLEALVERISRARVVMLGESTHGTQEFYQWRRLITEWLIAKHGYRFVAVEGDWPDMHRIDRYVRGRSEHGSAREALETLRRWPTWMWANTEVARLAEWMKTRNARVKRENQVGFYGLDIYSLFESIDCVLEYLESVNPMLARRARLRYECFAPYGRDEFAYARAALDLGSSCEREVVQQLQEIMRMRAEPCGAGGPNESMELFDAQQNARVIAGAESYYRAIVHGDDISWNIRDAHMMETLEALLGKAGEKGIVWAHNTHIGDYRATSMRDAGLVNLGGLAREKLGEPEVALVGFGTHSGRVVASHSWDGPIQSLPVPPARPDSYEAILHERCRILGAENLFLVHDERDRASGPLSERRGHRAIGVVYDPEHENRSNYVPTVLARRYDAFVFCDRTTALEPLLIPHELHELPETWPSGA